MVVKVMVTCDPAQTGEGVTLVTEIVWLNPTKDPERKKK